MGVVRFSLVKKGMKFFSMGDSGLQGSGTCEKFMFVNIFGLLFVD